MMQVHLLASFTTATDSKTGASASHISVAGVGYDKNSGGTELDRRMKEILIDAFNKKSKKDIREGWLNYGRKLRSQGDSAC